MDQVVIKRDGMYYPLFRYRGTMGITQAEQIIDLSGQDVVNLSITSAEVFHFEIGDEIDVFGRLYRLNVLPNLRKVNDRKFEYEVQFEGLQYDMIKVIYLDVDVSGFSIGSAFSLMGDIESFANLIISNLNRVYGAGKWELGTFPDNTLVQNLDFQNETCLAVLQRLCDIFETNFDIERLPYSKFRLNLRSPDNTLPDVFRYGRAKGLYTLERNKSSDKNILTRLFAFGASKNLPLNYRQGALRLKMPVNSIFSEGQPYIEDISAIQKYGVIEGSIIYEDIYPTRTGTVTGINPANILQFYDSSMDFNLTQIFGGNTTYLIGGVSPKIVFKTGGLAGYEFNLNANTTNSGYVHPERKFTLLPYTDDNGNEFPSSTNIAFQIQPGDTYTIVDIAMPQSYINAAEQQLELKAGQYLLDNARPRVQYALSVDPNYIKSKELPGGEIINYFSVGNYLNVQDDDLQLNGKSQVQSLKRDLLNHYKYELTLGDEIPNSGNRKYRLRSKGQFKDTLPTTKGLNVYQNYQVTQIVNNVIQATPVGLPASTTLKTKKFFIGDGVAPPGYIEKPLSNIVQDDDLIGAEIVGMMYLDKNLVELDEDGVIFDDEAGSIDFSESVIGELMDGNKLVVTFN